VPELVRQEMEFVFAEEMGEVLAAALEPDLVTLPETPARGAPSEDETVVA
jgi:hypothetical protein